MDEIEKLAREFEKFPGIGRRQARRFVYFLLDSPAHYLSELAAKILFLGEKIKRCRSCFVFSGRLKDELCEICRDPATDKTLLMILEKDVDWENMRAGGIYRGGYFLLGQHSTRLKELLKIVEKRAREDNLKEIIIALSLNPQGEQMDFHVRKILSPLQEKHKLKISSLGRGLSTGLELEYSDADTLQNALKNRS